MVVLTNFILNIYCECNDSKVPLKNNAFHYLPPDLVKYSSCASNKNEINWSEADLY
jgi:hypothetical protein